jgi:hypothetical protein
VTQFVLDEATAAKLRQAAGFVELTDPSGRTVGFFTPPRDRAEYERMECPFTEEELAELEKAIDGPTFTTAEVLEHLAKLERP